jgi:hypothetical protein
VDGVIAVTSELVGTIKQPFYEAIAKQLGIGVASVYRVLAARRAA